MKAFAEPRAAICVNICHTARSSVPEARRTSMGTAVEEPSVGGSDPFASRDVTITEIVDQIERRGYFLAHVSPQPTQALIDLRWAAQMAGRRLGRPLRTYASAIGAQQSQKITLVVAPLDLSVTDDVQTRELVRSVIDDLVGGRRSPGRRPL
jgi:hypothetical protein